MKTPRLILGLALAIAATMSAVAEEPMPPMPAMADTAIFMHGVLDQFESRTDAFRWSGEAWVGGDRDKLWLKSEGFVLGRGNVEDGRHELLYDRAISAYADLQAGVRVDWDSVAGRTWAALGVQGMAPLFFNYEATAYFGDRACDVSVSEHLPRTIAGVGEPWTGERRGLVDHSLWLRRATYFRHQGAGACGRAGSAGDRGAFLPRRCGGFV